jgi:hypothetical protein
VGMIVILEAEEEETMQAILITTIEMMRQKM